jgi:nucleotide-binding universal stress UspA family protein
VPASGAVTVWKLRRPTGPETAGTAFTTPGRTMRLLRLSSVLVATDLDETSGPALRSGARLALLAEAGLHLIHAANTATANEKHRLREQLRLAGPDAPEPASLFITPGDPAPAIIERAERIGADAIILGPHRRGAAVSGEMGSTAASVVRWARCPCLVVATELRLPLERVLVPIDLSEVAEGALLVALSWATALRPRPGNAEVTALHVSPDPGDPAAEQAVQEEIGRVRARAGGSPYAAMRAVIESNPDPAAEILRRAAEEAVDLVVMGTRGAAGAASGFGSVSAAVARATTRPLLLVPPTTWEEHAAT